MSRIDLLPCTCVAGAPLAPTDVQYSVEENGVLIQWKRGSGNEALGYVIEGLNASKSYLVVRIQWYTHDSLANVPPYQFMIHIILLSTLYEAGHMLYESYSLIWLETL